jgi:ferredoxin
MTTLLPCYNLDLVEVIGELSEMPGYDASYVLEYHGSWSDFECDAWLAIFTKNGQYFMCDGGYSPEVGDVDEKLSYEPISIEKALEEIEDMEKACAEMARKHCPSKSSRVYR